MTADTKAPPVDTKPRLRYIGYISFLIMGIYTLYVLVILTPPPPPPPQKKPKTKRHLLFGSDQLRVMFRKYGSIASNPSIKT